MITAQNKFTQIDAKSYQNLLEDKSGILVDVRTKEEYDDAHLDGAINIDFYSSNFLAKFEKFNKNSPIFLYCNTGNRSLEALGILKKAGFNEVYDLKGGIIAWQISQMN